MGGSRGLERGKTEGLEDGSCETRISDLGFGHAHRSVGGSRGEKGG